jgi:hypothetical protein
MGMRAQTALWSAASSALPRKGLARKAAAPRAAASLRTASESCAVIRITGGCGPRWFSASSSCSPDIPCSFRSVMTQAAPPIAPLASSASAEA